MSETDTENDGYAWRARIRERPAMNQAYRVGVAVVGAAIVAFGLLTIPLPGPGWLIVFLGLGVWATEFAWAKRLLKWTKAKVGEWNDWYAAQSLFVRLLLGVLMCALVLAIFWAMFAISGIPSFVPGPVDGWLDNIPFVDPS